MKSFSPKLLTQESHSTQQPIRRPVEKSASFSNPGNLQRAKHMMSSNENIENERSMTKPTTYLHASSDNHHKVLKKPLVIDINAEPQSYNNNNNHPQPYTTTNSFGSPGRLFRGSGAVGMNGPLSVKASKPTDNIFGASGTNSNKRNQSNPKTAAPPAGGIPYASINLSQNRIGSFSTSGSLDNFLNHLSPKSLHLRSISSKSYSFEPSKANGQESVQTNQITVNEQQKLVRQQHQPVLKERILSNIEPNTKSQSSIRIEERRPNENPAESESIIPYECIKREPNQNIKKTIAPIPNHEPTKCSIKRNGIVKAYAANTNQGIIRNYNEDRVSIILNIMKPASRMNEEWPKCSFFGVYDGHGGVSCADFLRDNLHQYVIKEPSFPWNPREALFRGIEAAEAAFLSYAENRPNGELDKSGSCAIVALIVGDVCYIANVGDSRAIMSGDGGTKVYHLSEDQKPSEEKEQKRIIEAGGRIYQTQAPVYKPTTDENGPKGQMQFIVGPHRVFPGRLSVSRTFGDIEAKLEKYGGNPNVVIATPEIKSFKIDDSHDFIILACDGIFDKLSSQEAIKAAWDSTIEKASDVHHQCGLAVEEVIRESLYRRTLDNVTVLMICLKNFKHKLFPKSKQPSAAAREATKKHVEADLVHNSVASRPHVQESRPEMRVLRDRTDNHNNHFNENLSSQHIEKNHNRKANGLQKEDGSHGTVQPGKKMVEREIMRTRDHPHTTKHGNGTTTKSFSSSSNNENKGFDSYLDYFDYIQNNKLNKQRQADSKITNPFRSGLKAEAKH